MKLFTFEIEGKNRLGAELRGQLIDLPAAYAALIALRDRKPGLPEGLPNDMLGFIRLGDPALQAVKEALAFMAKRPALPVGERASYIFDEVKVKAPILCPGKILCFGIPESADFFIKLSSALIGHGAAILCPHGCKQLDAGICLGIVVGQRMKAVPAPEVTARLFGYTILNDVGCSDMDGKTTLAKNCDTFCPLGPCIVTEDEVKPSLDSGFRMVMNGKAHETVNFLHLQKLISHLSRSITLEPGDIIGIGTLGNRLPLGAESVVRSEVEGIGILENPIICE